MRRRDHLLALLAALLLVVGLRLTSDLYRWWAYQEERATITALRPELEEAALGVVRTQLMLDSLQARVAELDAELDREREVLETREAAISGGAVTGAMEARYRQSLEGYNRRARARNQLLSQWRVAVRANHEHVDRYNALADSLRALSARAGEPHYPVPTPAEIADRLELAVPPGSGAGGERM